MASSLLRARPSGPKADIATSPAPVLVGLLVALVPLTYGSVVWSAPGTNDPDRWIAVGPADIISLAIVVVWARAVLDRDDRGHIRLRNTPLCWAAAVALGLEVVALAAHPSPRGVELIARLVAAGATADLTRRITDERSRRILLATVAAVGTAEALLAVAQSWTGRPLALRPFAFEGELWQYGTSWAGRGGFDHQYHLACLLALAIGAAALGAHGARRPLPWYLAMGVCATGMAVTFSRAGVLGLAATIGVALVAWLRNRDRSGWMALALVAGVAVGMTTFGNGWVSRSQTTLDKTDVDSGRRDRAAEALRLIRKEPVVGVGPGRYVIALEDVPHVELRPAHDLPLHVAAEAGIVAGLAAAAALVLLTIRCARIGARCLMVLVPMVPFLLLDAYPYSWPGGLAISGVWLGLLGRAWYLGPPS